MDFSTLAIIQAVLWLVVGAAFLAIPQLWVAPFGVRLNAESTFMGRLLGASFLSLAVLSFVGRDTADVAGQQAIAYANIFANGLTAALHAADLMGARLLNNRAWGQVVLTTALAIAWIVIGLPR